MALRPWHGLTSKRIVGIRMATQWFYNSNSGSIQSSDLTSIIGNPQLHLGLGWHGPFTSKQAAIDYYNKYKSQNPGWKPPTTDLGQAFQNTVSTGVSGITSGITSGLGLSNEQLQSWLVRIGEILLGIVLVGVGLAKLTGTTNAVAGLVKAKI